MKSPTILPPSLTKPTSMIKLLTDGSAPKEIRLHLLRQACLDESGEKVLDQLLDAASAAKAEDHFKKKTEILNQTLKQMEEGPIRIGTFLGVSQVNGSPARVDVAFADGSRALCTAPKKELLQDIAVGDTLLVEAQARAVLDAEPLGDLTGEEARLERRIGRDRVEVNLREQGRFVFIASDYLRRQLDDEEARPGDQVVVCAQRMVAFGALPPEDGLAHLQFLDRSPVPDVWIDRDIGAPPAFLGEITAFLERELHDPEIGRRYGLRRSWLQLLTGVSGTGKSLSIQALCRWIAEASSAITGIPVDELPSRVMRMRPSGVLSKWFGESDRLVARFFDEVDDLSGRPVVGVDGREHELPVVVIIEEADGLARARGEDSIHDRVLTNLLGRLDTTVNRELSDRLVIVLCTTNVPHLVDPAFLRRSGANVERFGRLPRRDFMDVLAKHLGRRPAVHPGTAGDDEARAEIVHDVTAWLYGPRGEDAGQVEVTYVGSSTPEIKHRRSFLTGGLVDRAVQQACQVACRAEYAGRGPGGLDAGLLMQAIDEQVRHIVDQLDRNNAGQYLTLPEGARVGAVRRLEASPVVPGVLERVS